MATNTKIPDGNSLVKVRDMFGGSVGWDAKTGNISLPGGVTLTKGNYTIKDGSAYATPSQISALYGNRGTSPATPPPSTSVPRSTTPTPATTTTPIPLNPPKGTMGIRDLFGGNVGWDAKTGNISLPGGITLGQGDYTLTQAGRSYINPTALAGTYLTSRPAEITPEQFQQSANVQSQLLRPQYEAQASALQNMLRQIQAQAESQRATAEANYSGARMNLKSQEKDSWNRMMKSASARGLDNSGLMNYEQHKVTEAFAPQYQQLESQQAAVLANIARDSALSTDNLAQAAKELEAAYLTQLNQGAYNQLEKDRERQAQQNLQIANYLMGLGDKSDQKQQQEFQNALALAGVTGNFVDPEVRSLVDSIIQAKKDYTNASDADKKQIAAISNSARDQLAARGIDPNLFASGMSLDKVYQNMAKLGSSTLQKQQMDTEQLRWLSEASGYLPGGRPTLDRQYKEGQLNLDAGRLDLANREFGLNQDKFAYEQYLSGEELALKRAGQALQQANLDFEQGKYGDIKTSEQATNKVMAGILRAESREEALKVLGSNAGTYAADGVDMGKVLAALDSKFPGVKDMLEYEMMYGGQGN